jgi:hypothetical protein
VAGRSKASTSFLKKRNKKLFHAVASAARNAQQKTKVFWFFFSKKNILPALALPLAGAAQSPGLFVLFWSG